jgi:hypothetical protein
MNAKLITPIHSKFISEGRNNQIQTIAINMSHRAAART